MITLLQLLSFVGPGALIAVGYMDPGEYRMILFITSRADLQHLLIRQEIGRQILPEAVHSDIHCFL